MESVKAHIENLTELKKKYAQMLEEEDHFWNCLETRALHLAALSEVGVSKESSPVDNTLPIDFDQFFAMKLDRTILDWMLRQGYFTTAKLFAEAKGIAEFSDLPIFQEIARVKQALAADQNCLPALQWCNSNRTKLGRAWSSLEFKLRM